MKEVEQILALWSQLEVKNEPAVLATVVKTSGSSYRLPGARMLLTRTGQRAGSISGGCLEDDIVKRAWWFTENGPIVRRYDTTPDGEIAAEYGLGCNGIIHVLIEQIKPGSDEVVRLMRDVRQTRRSAAVAHCVTPASAAGQRLILDTNGRLRGKLPSHADPVALERLLKEAVLSGKSGLARLDASTEIFVETLVPALRLLVFGAGEDAVPVVDLAKNLGWEVFVYDGRAHYARREKFANADGVKVRTPGDGGPLPVDHWTAAVLMSHSYSQDLEMLKELADAPLCYLGVLGPRKRAVQMLQEAAIKHEFGNTALHSPMGLDIGADGPDQVALSVVAEIQGTLNGRFGGPLRERAGSIHAEQNASGSPASEETWVSSIICA